MHTRSITSSSTEIISNLKTAVESIIVEFQQIQLSTADIRDATAFEKLEIDLHEKATKLADLTSAIKLQEILNSNELAEAEKHLIKSHPRKMKNMGRRTIYIHMVGGTLVAIEATYYHQKSDTKSRSKKGFYPRLLL